VAGVARRAIGRGEMGKPSAGKEWRPAAQMAPQTPSSSTRTMVVSWDVMVWPATWAEYAAGLGKLWLECGDGIAACAARHRVDDAYVLAGL